MDKVDKLLAARERRILARRWLRHHKGEIVMSIAVPIVVFIITGSMGMIW